MAVTTVPALLTRINTILADTVPDDSIDPGEHRRILVDALDTLSDRSSLRTFVLDGWDDSDPDATLPGDALPGDQLDWRN